MLVVKEQLCSQSNEGFRKQKWSQSYYFIIIIVSRGLSWFHFYWSLVPSLTFNRFLPSLKGRMLTRWIHHRISSRAFTFHHGRLLIFISKRRQRSCAWSSPCQHCAAVSGALLHFCFIMWKSRETAENNRWSAGNRAGFYAFIYQQVALQPPDAMFVGLVQ